MAKAPKTKGHKKALLKLGNVCGICFKTIDHPETATIDHIIPLSKGGTNYRNNVQLAHPRCNRKKADKVLAPQELKRNTLTRFAIMEAQTNKH